MDQLARGLHPCSHLLDHEEHLCCLHDVPCCRSLSDAEHTEEGKGEEDTADVVAGLSEEVSDWRHVPHSPRVDPVDGVEGHIGEDQHHGGEAHDLWVLVHVEVDEVVRLQGARKPGKGENIRSDSSWNQGSNPVPERTQDNCRDGLVSSLVAVRPSPGGDVHLVRVGEEPFRTRRFVFHVAKVSRDLLPALTQSQSSAWYSSSSFTEINGPPAQKA
mmetsp:Transcript_11971/g.41303  ORF Transcript_11971/g.41303 Transcript_11971/m.41303 type:complete len:216 (+) Transcript_11971:1299-1946(+)